MTCTYCNGEGKIPSTEVHRGRRVDIYVPCWRCRTTGLIEIACLECGDTGTRFRFGELTDYWREPCTCDAGRIAEQRAIDADKAEWEAGLPDYDAMAHESVAAGNPPY